MSGLVSLQCEKGKGKDAQGRTRTGSVSSRAGYLNIVPRANCGHPLPCVVAWLRVPLTWVPAGQALKRRKRRGSTRMKPQMNEGRGTGECFFQKVRTLSRHARSISQTFTFPPSHPLTTSVSETWKSKEKYLNQCVGGASPNVILWTKVNIKKSTVIVVKTKSTLLNWKNYSSIAYINCLYHVSMTKRPPALASSKVPHWKKTFSKV